MNQPIENLINAKALELGFDLFGITEAKEHSHYIYYEDWINNKYHAAMNYMERRLIERKNPQSCLENAQTIISLGLSYKIEQKLSNKNGIISIYAQNLDYHKVIIKKLKKLCKYISELEPESYNRPICDTAPLLERAFAESAGLGWIGKNTCLINNKKGSYFFLGEILTSLKLVTNDKVKNYCGKCTQCMDICPTKAIIAPYQLDSRKCISYWTIEHRGDIPQVLWEGIGSHIFGCDLCQAVCPWNKKTDMTTHQEFYPADSILQMKLEDWHNLGEEKFNLMFQKSPIKRSKWDGFLRNVKIACKNNGIVI